MGFTITNGKAILENEHPYRHGDGVLISGSQVGLKMLWSKTMTELVSMFTGKPNLENVTISGLML